MPLPKIPKVKLAPPLSALSQAEREANLAKMLNESAIKDRMYHGTNQDITSFRPNLKSDATFLTPKPELANKFAMDDLLYDSNSTYRGARSGANVMPVYAQVKNPWDYENPAHIEAVAKILDPQDRKAFIKQAPTGNWISPHWRERTGPMYASLAGVTRDYRQPCTWLNAATGWCCWRRSA